MVEGPKKLLYLWARINNTERKISFIWETIKYLGTVDLLDITLDKNMNLGKS